MSKKIIETKKQLKLLEEKIKSSSGKNFIKFTTEYTELFNKLIDLQKKGLDTTKNVAVEAPKAKMMSTKIKMNQNIIPESKEMQIEKIVKQATKVVQVSASKKEKKDKADGKIVKPTIKKYNINGKSLTTDKPLALHRLIVKELNAFRKEKIKHLYQINLNAYRSLEDDDYDEHTGLIIVPPRLLIHDAKGKPYKLSNKFFMTAIDFDISKYRIGIHYYSVTNENEKFHKFKTKFLNSLGRLNKYTVDGIANLDNYFECFNIVSVFNNDMEKRKYEKPVLLNVKFKLDDFNKGINSKYTKYQINKNANTFKDLIQVDFTCDYLREHYIKKSCFLTCIINKFYNHFSRINATNGKRYYKNDITYKYLCELLKLKYNEDGIACSIPQALPFFEKFKLGLFVYDQYQKLIYRYEPELLNKNNYQALRVIAKDEHLYEINENVKSLQQTVERDEEEIDNLYVNDKFYINTETEEVVNEKLHSIKNNDIEEITKYVKLYATEDKKKEKINLRLITHYNNDLSTMLIEMFSNGYTPNVYFRSYVYRITLQFDNIFVSVENPDISTQSEHIIQINNTEEYKEFQLANAKLIKDIIKDEYLSTYHESVIDIEDKYTIASDCGLLETVDKDDNIRGMDMQKCYSYHLSNINKVPIFTYFDVYKKYNDEPIEDYTYYIIKLYATKLKSEILFREKYSRTYGFVLKEVKFKYDILYYRTPSKIIDVDFKTPIDDIYNNKKLKMEHKKYIVNKLTGNLEKKENSKSLSKCFSNFNDANYHTILYSGKTIPVYRESTEKDMKGLTNMQALKWLMERQPDLYIVNVEKTKRLVNGLSPIKDIIYCRQKLVLYHQYFKFRQLGYIPVGIKTDCMYYKSLQKIPIQKQLKSNYDFTKDKIGAFKKETDEKNIEKIKFYKLLKVDYNELIEFKDFEKVEPKIFDDEYDKEAINKYILDSKVVMLKGLYPGVGKTHTVLNLGLKTLFVLPENTLARDIKKQGHDAITINKLFGLDANDKNLKNCKFDVSEYKCICFDEIAKHNIDRLIRISKFIEENKDKIIIGSGDTNQIKPISYNGKLFYLNECFKILFPNQILFKVIKRADNPEDKQKWIELYKYIFENENKINVKEMCKQFGLNTINDINKVETLNNMSFLNSRCQQVNDHIHHNILKHTEKYFIGLEVVNRKYYRESAFTLNVNYTYIIHKFSKIKNVQMVTLHDDVENEYYTIPKTLMENNFTLSYCRTIDSSQGRSITDKFTIFDIGSDYITKQHLWTAITRATKLSNIYIFIHSNEEIKNMRATRMFIYFVEKIRGYKYQDKIANRVIDEPNYLSPPYIFGALTECGYKCTYCSKSFNIGLDGDSNYKTDITFDRIVNSVCHTKSNCIPACLKCNTSRSNK
jgi:hypothetical protein